MSRTRIDWADYTINPVKGLCPVGCSFCYARRLYHRFKWNTEIRYIEPGFTIAELQKMPAGSRVFWGSTIELFHDVIPALWRKDIFAIVRQFPELTHIFLTKQPENLPREWPDNCWVGVSVTGDEAMKDAYEGLDCTRAQVKFLSLEPLLGPLSKTNLELIGAGYHYRWLDWLIIGQQTPVRKSTMPKLEWISEIVQAADRASVPVFCKDNLDCLIGQDQQFKRFRGYDSEGNMLVGLRQEFPKVKSHAQ